MDILYKPSVLELAQDAHSDTRIYREVNEELHGRGYCKENTERLLQYFERLGHELTQFSVIYFRRYDYDGLSICLPFDKAALRKEEARFVFRHVLTFRYRQRQAFLEFHFAILDKYLRVFDLSARRDLIGVPFQQYFEAIFYIELNKYREELLHEIVMKVCPADLYFNNNNMGHDHGLIGFERVNLRYLLNQNRTRVLKKDK